MKRVLLIIVLLAVVLVTAAGMAVAVTPSPVLATTAAISAGQPSPAMTTMAPTTHARDLGWPAKVAAIPADARSGPQAMSLRFDNNGTLSPAIADATPARPMDLVRTTRITQDCHAALICKAPTMAIAGPTSGLCAHHAWISVTGACTDSAIQMTGIINNKSMEIANGAATKIALGDTYALLPTNDESHISTGLVLMHF